MIHSEIWSWFSVYELRDNPDKIFVFGDNLQEWGKAGQAVIRDEPNAMGIPTKVKPTMEEDAFFTDEEPAGKHFRIDIEKAIRKISTRAKEESAVVVFPASGIGTGLASMRTKAPNAFSYLNHRIMEEFGIEFSPFRPSAL